MTNNLREVRKSLNVRLMQLTAQCGVNASTLSAIECYNYKPRETTKQRIAEALGVPLETIWPASS